MLFYDVTKYGAIGDGIANDTKAIQKAIDTCASVGGGVVYLPSGKYLSGTIFLKSNITLWLEAGAVLLPSLSKKEFSFIQASQSGMKACGLICGEGVENITICGKGKIDGSDKEFWEPLETYGESWNSTALRFRAKQWRPHGILLKACKNITIKDILIERSSVYAAFFVDCDFMNVFGISVLNDFHGPNTDGFHFRSCQHVHVSNSYFHTGDDAIAIDSNGEQASNNITITNCSFTTSINVLRVYTGLFLGGKYVKYGEVRNITLSNCSVSNAADIINIVAENGLVENIIVSSITFNLEKEGTPIFMMTKDGNINNVTISNLIGSANGVGTMIGTDKDYISNILLNNFQLLLRPKRKLYSQEIPDPIPNYSDHHFAPYSLYLKYIRKITLDNIKLEWEQPEDEAWGSLIKCRNLEDINIHRFWGKHSGTNSKEPTILFEDVKNAFIQGCIAPTNTNIFLLISGAQTEDINLIGNNFRQARNTVLKKDITKNNVCQKGNI